MSGDEKGMRDLIQEASRMLHNLSATAASQVDAKQMRLTVEGALGELKQLQGEVER